MKQKTLSTILILVITLIMSACTPVGGSAINNTAGGSASFAGYPTVQEDLNVYEITGKVIGEPEGITSTHASGSSYMYSNIGGGSFVVWQDGKGFVRLTVSSANPETALAPVGKSIIVKTEDRKAMALIPGDTVTFKCRVQFESVAAIANLETFNENTYGTRELDYCRMETPIISK